MLADQRRLEVLRAIVEDYIAHREPVGSKLIAQRHGLGVSSATIRNDMAILEEAGLIAQPHTSAGRIPTDLGYRVFVDQLSEVKPLSSAERTAIRAFLESAVDLDDVVNRAGRLLAQITGQVAIVQYPVLSRSTVRHLELVRLHESKILLVIITDTGRVEQRMINLEPGEVLDEAELATFKNDLNAAVVGRKHHDVALELERLVDRSPSTGQELLRRIALRIIDELAVEADERIVLAGTSNLTRTGAGILNLRPILETLEEQVVLLKLLSEMADDSAGVAVRIGHETQFAGLHEASVITTAYGGAGEPLGSLGSLGPTGMDYSGTIAAVRAVARYLTRILSS
ncbi:heat-inducible transcriptional repressor HrcA [Timonella senegalensis]|uniref:heat-inducible transcriptional repressor HrcA n=1 Tax=Timonella senegalensis TaxID=1465825 RepID=UPI0002F7086E|nr:heat-inducible transcriptional repressor HrcA [Timonella senegalensis]